MRAIPCVVPDDSTQRSRLTRSGITFLEHSASADPQTWPKNGWRERERERIPATLINLNHSEIVPILGPRESRLLD